MRKGVRRVSAIVATAAGLSVAACGHKQDTTATAGGDVAYPSSSTSPAATPTTDPATPVAVGPTAQVPVHHSKLKGALIGAAAGHVLGGHAVAGAAAGALLQHERNKHP
jgi:hypothetical protein